MENYILIRSSTLFIFSQWKIHTSNMMNMEFLCKIYKLKRNAKSVINAIMKIYYIRMQFDLFASIDVEFTEFMGNFREIKCVLWLY